MVIMISIRILKICGKSICKPLELIFKTCLRNGRFPLEWNKANVVPIHKKGDKQTIKNYRPVSLLPTCGKIFEPLLYDTMFDFFSKNNLLSPNQSGFRLGDSCINQLLSINHEEIWHDGLIFKLSQNGICDEMVNTLVDFLSDRKQRVVLNGQCSSWADIHAGVSQVSIL